jgi:organic hydroperoxide reductase OsmC/OhrA
MRKHTYVLKIEWTGNTGSGTFDYRAYERSHTITAPGKPIILGSSDPAFRGDATAYNPEEMLLSALSTCHMLWFLHLCADEGVVVTAYSDEPMAILHEDGKEGGRFEKAVLHPRVELANQHQRPLLNKLHELAHEKCFIAASVNFPVIWEPIHS